jgi:hypothetical protein
LIVVTYFPIVPWDMQRIAFEAGFADFSGAADRRRQTSAFRDADCRLRVVHGRPGFASGQ